MSLEQIKKRIKELKEESGTHSPSIGTMLEAIPTLKIKVDACFLSNPYATDLFMSKLQAIYGTRQFRDILEYYPPQNYDVSRKISRILGIDSSNIFVGNGAIEVIQACIHKFSGKKIALPIPTFSSYYEFKREDSAIVYYQLQKSNNYKIDINDYIAFIRANACDTAILINPNNPVGDFVGSNAIRHFLGQLKDLELVVVDESFIHFAYEDQELSLISNESLVEEFPNLIIVKSMSKDFGIAGIRAGYGVMHKDRVRDLLFNGYLWNVSGLADYFFHVYADPEFQQLYEVERKRCIVDTIDFVRSLENIKGIKIYETKANFVLIEILSDSITSFDFCMELLIEKGIYLRDCSDKIGLDGKFIRIAARSRDENLQIAEAIKEFSKKYL